MYAGGTCRKQSLSEPRRRRFRQSLLEISRALAYRVLSSRNFAMCMLVEKETNNAGGHTLSQKVCPMFDHLDSF
jgi:hypothetical protein